MDGQPLSDARLGSRGTTLMGPVRGSARVQGLTAEAYETRGRRLPG